MSATDNQEAAQAYFCAIVDFLGATTAKKLASVNTYDEFIVFWGKHKQSGKTTLHELFDKHVKSGKSSFEDVEGVLKNAAWYRSSRNIGIKLIEEVTKNKYLTPFKNIAAVGWQDIFYAHQDASIMDMVAKLYQIVTVNHRDQYDKGKGWTPPFSDINKWSPADIYFATQHGADELKTATTRAGIKVNNWSYNELNEFMYDLWKSGHLLPVSLKKAGDTVYIKYINFEKTWEERKSNYTPTAIKEIKKKKSSVTANNTEEEEEDRRLKIQFQIPKGPFAGAQYSLEFATKASYPIKKGMERGHAQMKDLETKIKIELIPIGGNAKEGQVGPEGIGDILGLSDALKKIVKDADTLRKQFKDDNRVKKLIEKRKIQIQNGMGGKTPKYKMVGSKIQHPNDEGRKETIAFQEELAKLLNDNSIGFEKKLIEGVGTYFKNWRTNEKVKNDLRLLFMYAAARSQDSAKYIIAK